MTEVQALPEEKQPQPPPRSNRKWIALAIGGGCALIACAAVAVALVTGAILFPSRSIASVSTQAINEAPSIQQSGNRMGDPSAPVKIVEYADFQCPYCMHYWQSTEPQIVDTYVKTGKVYYEYRSVGGFLGEESQAAAEAAYCAGDQGKFWQYHDSLFSHWTGENVGDFTAEKLKQYAAALGLDQQAFDDCLDSHSKAQQVQQDVENAKADGIKATPSFLINGKLVEGAQPFEVFRQSIEDALQGK